MRRLPIVLGLIASPLLLASSEERPESAQSPLQADPVPQVDLLFEVPMAPVLAIMVFPTMR